MSPDAAELIPVRDSQPDRDKLDLIKQTVAKGTTDLELKLFLHACQRTGLDPLMKQIYAIKRWSSVDKREVMAIQTGIDGYRLIADRTERYAGSDEPGYGFDEDGHPVSASVTVYKLVGRERCPFQASARWAEYVQVKQDGTPTAMWKKMPYLMLAKCAEALALRKAFPAELSGIYTHEEMMQADNGPLKLGDVSAKKGPREAISEEEAIKIIKTFDENNRAIRQADGLGGGHESLDAPASARVQAPASQDAPAPSFDQSDSAWQDYVSNLDYGLYTRTKAILAVEKPELLTGKDRDHFRNTAEDIKRKEVKKK